jgi:hypothetical protein
MSSGIGNGASAASYDRFNSAVNTNITLTDANSTAVGDKTQIVGSKEHSKIEALTRPLEKSADFKVSSDGVDNSAGTISPTEKKLNDIVSNHGGSI